MKQACKYETSVLTAVKTDVWDDSTRLHFETCPTCQEHVHLWKHMREFAEQTRKMAPDSAYGIVWLKARFQEKYLAQEKALRPLVIFPLIAAAVLGAAFMVLVSLNWQIAQESFKNLLSGSTANIEMTGMVLGLLSLFCALLFLGAMFFVTSNSFVKE